jgi:hypothetical protein
VDEITVTIPRERPFGAVAGLVLGGIAARHELTLDVLDDLHLALDTLLEREADHGHVTVVLRVADGALEASVGPFERAALADLEQEDGDGLGSGRVLRATVDAVELAERDGGCWVVLRKSYVATHEVH